LTAAGWGWNWGADLHVHFCGGGDDHGSPEFATQGAEVVFDDDDDVDDYGKG
jgi:hypothetical protein